MKRKLYEQDLFDLYINQDALMKFTSGSEPLNSEPDSIGDSNLEQRNDSVPPNNELALQVFYVDPYPHISPVYFTFNQSSYVLMINCILSERVARYDEIKSVIPATVLEIWRNVWKDRREKTGFITAWKRIQKKLDVRVEPTTGENLLYFKKNSARFISFIEQWQDIVMSYHSEGNSRHLGFKDTIDRVKTMWNVNFKFYGIPEEFIRVCVNYCPVCCDPSSGLAPVSKRFKFEFTETFNLPVSQVGMRLQELAKEYKAVLCVNQRYIRYTPFLSEEIDYACNRAGGSMINDLQDSKKESHRSKRCGCRFRIRVIRPVLELHADRTLVYKYDGVAVFQLDTVHSGHELEDIGGVSMDQDIGYGMREAEEESSGHVMTVSGNLKDSLMSHLNEIKSKVELLQGKVENMPSDMLASAAQAAFEALDKFRSLEEHVLNQHSDQVLVGTDLEDSGHDEMIPGNNKPAELIADDGNSFGPTLGNVASWGLVSTDCRGTRDWSLSHALGDESSKCKVVKVIMIVML